MFNEETAEIINILLMRHQVLSLAVTGLMRRLPDASKRSCAEELRADVADQMQALADKLTPAVDEAMTLELSQQLEALGFPPAPPKET